MCVFVSERGKLGCPADVAIVYSAGYDWGPFAQAQSTSLMDVFEDEMNPKRVQGSDTGSQLTPLG